jgi:hypothetical protein
MIDSGVITGPPRRWLRLEAAALLALSVVAFSTTNQSWWLIAIAFLVPDLSAIGYLLDSRRGSWLYNLAHATPAPIALLALGWWSHDRLVLALALVWFMHIGFDRLLGYGLKYEDDFQHTHLGQLGIRNEKSQTSDHATVLS